MRVVAAEKDLRAETHGLAKPAAETGIVGADDARVVDAADLDRSRRRAVGDPKRVVALLVRGVEQQVAAERRWR